MKTWQKMIAGGVIAVALVLGGYSGNVITVNAVPVREDSGAVTTDPNNNNNNNNNNNTNNNGTNPTGGATSATGGGGTDASGIVPAKEPDKKTNILNDEGLEGLVKLAVGILTAGIWITGVAAITVVGIQIMTARDNAAQVAQGKKRLLEIVIGIALFTLMNVILGFLLEGK